MKYQISTNLSSITKLNTWKYIEDSLDEIDLNIDASYHEIPIREVIYILPVKGLLIHFFWDNSNYFYQ